LKITYNGGKMTKYVCKTCGTEKEAEEASVCETCGLLMEESTENPGMNEDDDIDDNEDDFEE